MIIAAARTNPRSAPIKVFLVILGEEGEEGRVGSYRGIASPVLITLFTSKGYQYRGIASPVLITLFTSKGKCFWRRRFTALASLGLGEVTFIVMV